jgi:signal transduction histidine kinase
MFVNMISHEFRTPLAIVSGNLEIIEERGVPDGPLTGPFQKIGRAVHRIVEVYSLVLGRTRLDAIAPRLDRQPVDPVAFAAEILQRLGELWPERDIVFAPTATGVEFGRGGKTMQPETSASVVG